MIVEREVVEGFAIEVDRTTIVARQLGTQQPARDLGSIDAIGPIGAAVTDSRQDAMQQLVDQPARHRFDAFAFTRRKAHQPCAMTFELEFAQLLDAGADVPDRGNQIQPLEPFEKRFDLEVDDALGLFRLAFAIADRFLHHSAEVIDVVQVNVLQRIEALVEIARYAKVDHQDGPVAPLADHAFKLVRSDYRRGGGKRSNHDVGELQIGLKAVEGDRGPIKLTG